MPRPTRRPARAGGVPGPARPDRAATPVVAVAHRGGAGHPQLHGLENSLAAFEHAAALGYTELETDVHLTRDGVLVALHDTTLDRVSDRTGTVADLDAAEVARARIAGREPVPTMRDLLRALPQARFVIDLKSEAAGPALADLLRAEGAESRVVVGSFSARRLRRFRGRTGGRVPTSAHPLEVVAYRVLPSARLARWATRGRPRALHVPARRGPLRVVTPGLLARAHASGLPVLVWVVDDPDEMRALLDLGVDGLMTDRTDLLREVLVARGCWPDAADGS